MSYRLICLLLFSFIVFANPFFPDDTLLIMATGDIMLDRNVENFQRARAWHYPFYNIAPFLDRADFLTGNLESMISDAGKRLPKKYCFRADIGQMRLMEIAGFDCVTVGNNHSFDYTTGAFIDCIDELRQVNIIPVGGGRNLKEAQTAEFFNVGGTILGCMGFNDTRTNFIRPERPSTVPTWGTSKTLSNLIPKIEDAKKNCDILMVHIHWGDEDTTMPNPNQIAIGRSMIEAGADVVIGHHPHRLQSIEFYDDPSSEHSGIIAYSLGNFIFDQNDYLNNLSGILLLKTYNGKIIEVAMKPIEMISSPRATSPAKGKHFYDIFKLMQEISLPFGTGVRESPDSILIFHRLSNN